MFILSYALLTFAIWITYYYVLQSSFVIDDSESFPPYDGKLKEPKYGSIIKWIRYHIVGGNQPSKHKYPDGKRIPCGKVPFRHHFLSILVFNLAVISTFPWLSQLIGTKLAFMSLLLLIVHPLTVQAVGWISGIGYTLALLWLSLSMNSILLFQGQTNFWVQLTIIVSFTVLQFLMIEALVSTALFCVILALLGYYPFAIISALVCAYLGLNIVLETWKLRQKTFISQGMKKSTFIKPRKLIVALKTLAYYSKLIIWPNKLGLYHKYGYHYDEDIEREDWVTLVGLIIVISLITVYFVFPIAPIRLGIILFIFLLLPFLNFITVQQFIAERYVFLPNIGICILLAFLTQNYLFLYTFIIGALWIRTLLHLPTYDDEVRFYQSNVWNFPDLEIPYGNLGCSFLRLGYSGLAVDNWKLSSNINPLYDVPLYNLFSHYKANAMIRLQNGDLGSTVAMLKEGEPFLKRAIESPMCHFKELWTNEYNEVVGWIRNPYSMLPMERERIDKLIVELSKRLKDPQEKDMDGVTKSLLDAKLKIEQLDKVIEAEKKKCESQLQAAKVSSESTSSNSSENVTTK